MKVQEFTIEQFLEELRRDPVRSRGFYSTAYNRSFPLNGGLVVKLDPVVKEDARRLARESAERMKLLNSNYSSEPAVFAPNEYFLFRGWAEVDFERKRDLNIRFRTLSNDRAVDDFLEYLQESDIIGSCCEKGFARARVDENERLGGALYEAINRCLPMIKSPEGTLLYMKEGLRREWIEDKLSSIYNSIGIMEEKGHDMQEAIQRIRGIKTNVYATYTDRIWETGMDVLAQVYKR